MRTATSEPPLAWWQWILGHHPKSQWDRCYVLRIGSRELPICARCLGLYPSMLLGLILGSLLHVSVPAWLLGLALGLGFLDWSLTRIGYRESSNPQRTVSGSLAGLALGWAVGARLPLRLAPDQWRELLVFGLAAALVEIAAQWMD